MSLIMQNIQNIQNIQNMQTMQEMHLLFLLFLLFHRFYPRHPRHPLTVGEHAMEQARLRIKPKKIQLKISGHFARRPGVSEKIR